MEGSLQVSPGREVPGGGGRAEGLRRPRPAGLESSWPPRRGRSSPEPGGAAGGGASAQAWPLGSPDGGAEVRTPSGRSRRAEAGDSAPAWEPESSWGREVVQRGRREMRRRPPRSGEPRPSAIAASGSRLFLSRLPPSPAFRPCGPAPPAPSEVTRALWGEDMPEASSGLCPKEAGWTRLAAAGEASGLEDPC